MKRTMLNYEEVKGLLLQGYEVKLPEWQGYWKMNDEKDGIEVHTKDGKILDTPQIMYTFHSNWEIATVDNCPVLRREKLENNKKKNFEIIDITVLNLSPFIGDTPIIVVKMDGEERPKMLRLSEFEELVGGREEVMKMFMEFTLSKTPKELKKMLIDIFDQEYFTKYL